jgi:hypothetical protein
VREPILPIAYVPFSLPWHKESLIVRISSSIAANPMAIVAVLRQEVSRAGQGFRVTRIRTQQAMLDAQTVRERLLAMLAVRGRSVFVILQRERDSKLCRQQEDAFERVFLRDARQNRPPEA